MRNECGFVALSRADLRELGSDGSVLAVWVKLNEWAQWAAGRREHAGRLFQLARGQLVTSSRSLEKALGFGRQVVRRCLAALERLGRIAVEVRTAGSVITIKGYGAPSSSVSRTPKVPAQASTHQPDQLATPVALDPQRLDDEVPWPDDVDQPIDRPIYKQEPQQESKTKPYPAHSTRAREREGVSASGFPSNKAAPVDADDVVTYAQRRLGRIFAARELLAFLETWSTAPWLTAEQLKRNIDWIATHPLARRDTKSVTRAFYVDKAREAYRPFDESVRRAIAEARAAGVGDGDIAELVVQRTPSLDAETVRVYVSSILDALAGAA